ncbi:MAG: hypothetical protein EOM59_05555 [Clostridia bacterium]|nr:hypothetical protein [Clostridia bacterium]
MKVLIIMGSPRAQGNTAEILKPFIARLLERDSIVEYVALTEKKVLPCMGCGHCQNIQDEYGCIQEDDVAEVMEKLVDADCIVFATPIYSWFCTAQMKAFLDRHYGLNKYYGTASGSLWAGKLVALITTHGYSADYANGPFEEGMKRLCAHSKLYYAGLYSARDTQYLEAFKTKEVIAGAVSFADQLLDLDKSAYVELKEIIIDGKSFDDLEGFYKEIEKKFTKDLSFSVGHNLDALNDLLRGGFGVHEYGEPISVKWIDFAKSKADLGEQVISKIMEIVEGLENSGHCCIFNTKD